MSTQSRTLEHSWFNRWSTHSCELNFLGSGFLFRNEQTSTETRGTYTRPDIRGCTDGMVWEKFAMWSSFFWIQHLYSATSKLVLRHGGPQCHECVYRMHMVKRVRREWSLVCDLVVPIALSGEDIERQKLSHLNFLDSPNDRPGCF